VTHGAIQAEIADCRMLVEELPPSRERSLALTKLDEAEMWADRAPIVTGDGEAAGRG
jgi:hypothetical protein